MAGVIQQSQRQATADIALGHDNRVRCLDARLGCQLQRGEERWSLDSRGMQQPHQFP